MVSYWNPDVGILYLSTCQLHSCATIRQNNVEELYSLIKFLRLRPLNDWQNFNEQIAQPVKAGRPTRALKRLHVSLQSDSSTRRFAERYCAIGRSESNHASAYQESNTEWKTTS